MCIRDSTYNVGIYLAELLNDDPRFTARTSRTTPTESLGTSNAGSLQQRVSMANSWPADYFVSIHCNSNTNPAINGSEVYVYQTYTQAYWLAQHILNSLVAQAGTRDNGVRLNPSLYVLRRTAMPAVLVELGYLSNTEDARKLRDDQPGFARGIYYGQMCIRDSAKAVAWAARRNIVTGVGGGRFEPSSPITREQLAAMLYRYANLQGPVQGSLSAFSDGEAVSPWARDAVQWAVNRGILTGKGSRLDPQGRATRAEAAAMLQRFAG